MTKTINVLIIEDEPLIINSFKSAFDSVEEVDGTIDFEYRFAKNCDAAAKEIDRAVKGKLFDLVLLNIDIGATTDGSLSCGEDLGVEIKETFPRAKMIVFSKHKDNYRLNNILQSINPEGFLIKSDIDFSALVKAIYNVLFEPPYYSSVVLRLLRRHITNDFVLDSIDRKLLYQLSKGTKTKDLPNFINLSKSGVERRKRHLKQIFGIDSGNDKDLLNAATEKGYL